MIYKHSDLIKLVALLPKDAIPHGVRRDLDTVFIDTTASGEYKWSRTSLANLILIFEANCTNWLIGEGYHSFVWVAPNDDTCEVELHLYSLVYKGKSGLECLVNAVVDVYNNRKL